MSGLGNYPGVRWLAWVTKLEKLMIELQDFDSIRLLLQNSDTPLPAPKIASHLGMKVERVYEVLVRLHDQGNARILLKPRGTGHPEQNLWESLR